MSEPCTCRPGDGSTLCPREDECYEACLNRPKRIQLRRTKGWRKPEGAISVARPTPWGNPFVLHGEGYDGCERHNFECAVTPESAVRKFRHSVLWPISGQPEVPCLDDIRRELRGHDLACWCPLDQPCHADVLLELANT